MFQSSRRHILTLSLEWEPSGRAREFWSFVSRCTVRYDMLFEHEFGVYLYLQRSSAKLEYFKDPHNHHSSYGDEKNGRPEKLLLLPNRGGEISSTAFYSSSIVHLAWDKQYFTPNKYEHLQMIFIKN